MVLIGSDNDVAQPGLRAGGDLARTSRRPHQDLHLPSIFGRFSDKGIDWAIFGYNREPLTRHDYPDTQNADENHFGHFRDFQQHARAGTLPAFIFWSRAGTLPATVSIPTMTSRLASSSSTMSTTPAQRQKLGLDIAHH
jgi:hypothetical protein